MSNPRNEGSQRGDHQPTGSGWASRRSGCQASLRVAEDAWWSFGHSQAGSISSSTAPPAWGSCRLASARPGCDVPVSPGLDQREVADLAVAQAVVDEGEELARHRGPGDVDAAPLGDAVVVDLELGPAVYMGDGLDGRPAQELRSLLGHLAPPSLAVRLAVLGDQEGIEAPALGGDRKSTRLNSSHTVISYAVFCLKKKTTNHSLKRRAGRPGSRVPRLMTLKSSCQSSQPAPARAVSTAAHIRRTIAVKRCIAKASH